MQRKKSKHTQTQAKKKKLYSISRKWKGIKKPNKTDINYQSSMIQKTGTSDGQQSKNFFLSIAIRQQYTLWKIEGNKKSSKTNVCRGYQLQGNLCCLLPISTDYNNQFIGIPTAFISTVTKSCTTNRLTNQFNAFQFNYPNSDKKGEKKTNLCNKIFFGWSINRITDFNEYR